MKTRILPIVFLLLLVGVILVIPYARAQVTVVGPGNVSSGHYPVPTTSTCGQFCNSPVYFLPSTGLVYMFLDNLILNASYPMYLYTSNNFGLTWTESQHLVFTVCTFQNGAFYISPSGTAYYAVGGGTYYFCIDSGTISGSTITWGHQTQVNITDTRQQAAPISVTSDANGDIWSCITSSTGEGTVVFEGAVAKDTLAGGVEACSLFNLNSGSNIGIIEAGWTCCSNVAMTGVSYISGSFTSPATLNGGSALAQWASQCTFSAGQIYCTGCAYASPIVCDDFNTFRYNPTAGTASSWGPPPSLTGSVHAPNAFGISADTGGTRFIVYAFNAPGSGNGTVAYSTSNDGGVMWTPWVNGTVERIVPTINEGLGFQGGGPIMSNGYGTGFWEGYAGSGVSLNYSVRMLSVPVLGSTTVSTVKVVACNFYELECWWEPLIFYGMYVGLWVGIGATMSIRARSMTYLFGAAVSYASLYLILLGELPYPFALMAFIGAFAYGLRLDGVF